MAINTLVVAFVLALVGITLVFGALSLVGVDKAVAGSIATAIMGGVPYLRESLDKYRLARKGVSRSVLSFDGFAFSTSRMTLYGTLILLAAMQIASGIGGLIAAELLPDTAEFQSAVPAIAAFTIVIVFPTVFLVGRWVGRRVASHGILVVFLIAVLARTLATILDSFILTRTTMKELIGMGPISQAMIGIPLFFALGLLGYWRGRHQRLGTYLAYLLGSVSTETRQSIVELAFEEAKKSPSS